MIVYHYHTTGRKLVARTCHILNVLKSVSPAILSTENVPVTSLGQGLYGAIRQADVTDRPEHLAARWPHSCPPADIYKLQP